MVDKQHVKDVILLLEKSDFDFRKFDKNNDRIISREELAILAIDNSASENGATRSVRTRDDRAGEDPNLQGLRGGRLCL